MPEERRYSRREFEAIFALAAEQESSLPGSAREGLNLAELQAIGQEVGLSPGRIASAAASLEQSGVPRRTSFLGIPFRVGRTVSLPRAPTDHEWGVLVAELRRTFAAEGKQSSTGVLREWRNGNLHATIEPIGTGYQLRLGTRKAQAAAYPLAGAYMLLMAVLTFNDGGTAGAIVFGAVGLLLLGGLARIPKWGRLREAQMEEIGELAVRLVSPGAGE